MTEIQIQVATNSSNHSPFDSWLDKLDLVTKARIKRRLGRVRLGNLGDWKSLGDQIAELRIDTGPGYRIYFVRYSNVIIILLGGGTKHGQNQDILKAKKLWQETRSNPKRFQIWPDG